MVAVDVGRTPARHTTGVMATPQTVSTDVGMAPGATDEWAFGSCGVAVGIASQRAYGTNGRPESGGQTARARGGRIVDHGGGYGRARRLDQ